MYNHVFCCYRYYVFANKKLYHKHHIYKIINR